jgi:hypothetical protein
LDKRSKQKKTKNKKMSKFDKIPGLYTSGFFCDEKLKKKNGPFHSEGSVD